MLIKASRVNCNSEARIPKIPKEPLRADDLGSTGYNITIKEPRTLLDQKFSKTNIFKERVAELAKIVEPNQAWTSQTNEVKKQVLPPDSRNENGLIRSYVMSRLGVEREARN